MKKIFYPKNNRQKNKGKKKSGCDIQKSSINPIEIEKKEDKKFDLDENIINELINIYEKFSVLDNVDNREE